MKTSAPEAQDLLAVARQELLDTLLPAVDSSLKYQVLMVANAMGIASREISAGLAAEQQTCADIQRFYQAQAPERARQPDEAQLAADIRARCFASQDEGLHELLLNLTQRKLQVSNPRYTKRYASR